MRNIFQKIALAPTSDVVVLEETEDLDQVEEEQDSDQEDLGVNSADEQSDASEPLPNIEQVIQERDGESSGSEF